MVVVSGGGVATTALIDFLGRWVRVNDAADADGLKHAVVPGAGGGRRVRVIYVVGDPAAAVVSLFGRGYHAVHSRKMQRGLWRDGDGLAWDVTLEAYARSGRDAFGFERHWENYAWRYLLYPTLLVRYEALWDVLPDVLDFAGVPREAVGDFPERRARKTNVDALPSAVRAGLRTIYGPWSDRVAAMPAFEVRWPARGARWMRRAGWAVWGRAAVAGARCLANQWTWHAATRPADEGRFAVSGELAEPAYEVLRDLGKLAGWEVAFLDRVSSRGGGAWIPRWVARRTITLSDAILAAHGVDSVDKLVRYVKKRFAVCAAARAVPVLRMEGGGVFLEWLGEKARMTGGEHRTRKDTGS